MTTPPLIPQPGTASDFMQRLKDYIQPFDPDWANTIQPATADNIARYYALSGLQKAQLPLSEYYRQFLLQAGENDGQLFKIINAEIKLSKILKYYEESLRLEPETIIPTLPVIARYELGDDISLDMRSPNNSEPAVYYTSDGEAGHCLAKNFEFFVFQCAFKYCIARYFTASAQWSASQQKLEVALPQPKAEQALQLIEQAAEQEGFTKLWCSDQNQIFGVRADAAYFASQYPHLGVLLVVKGREDTLPRQWGEQVGRMVGAI